MEEGNILNLEKENKQLKEEIRILKEKLSKFDNRGEQQKKGMMKKASSEGKIMTRPAFGYKIISGDLIPAENFREVEEIFEEFLNSNISLRKIARAHNFSVNGLKKILTNFTYIGKVKFNNQIHDGKHKPIISSTLFNHVQNKLERLKLQKRV